jgi:hypothetical protein
MLPLMLLPLAATAAIAAGEGIYNAAEAPKRRRIQMQQAKKNMYLDLLQKRAQEQGQGSAPQYSLDAARGVDQAQRKINLTPASQLPKNAGETPAADPTMFLPLVQSGAQLAGGVDNAITQSNYNDLKDQLAQAQLGALNPPDDFQNRYGSRSMS